MKKMILVNVQIDIEGRFCGTCRFLDGLDRYCWLFHQKPRISGKELVRCKRCLEQEPV